MSRCFILALFLFLFPFQVFCKPTWKVAVALNEDQNSSSTSNPIENHIENGIRLALAENPTMASSIHLTFINHGESAQKTLESIKKINLLKPDFVIGMGNSFQALLCAKHLTSDIKLISPVATSDDILKTSKNIFLLSNINSYQSKILVNVLKNKIHKKHKTLLVEVEGCPYCKNMSQQMAQEMKLLNIKYDTGKFHFTNLKKLKSNDLYKGYDHIVLPVHEEESALLISHFYAKNSLATYWGGDGWGPLARYIKRLSYAEKIKAFWLAHYHIDISNSVNKIFVANYRKQYSTDPVDTSAFYYEAMRLVMKINATLPVSLDTIKNLRTYEGITGTVYTKDRHVSRFMPLLSLKEGKVNIEELTHPKGNE